MEHDPRLAARSETYHGTHRIRPESVRPTKENAGARGPRLDLDDLIRAHDTESASGIRWRVRFDETALWWDSLGGYTRYPANAMKWSSRLDAYNDMIKQRTGQHSWDIEPETRAGTTRTGVARGARYDDLVQAWTRKSIGPGGHPVPGDGVVHALLGDIVPGRALCGTKVGFWTGRRWPPKDMHRCAQCNSLATTLPGG